MMQTRLAFRLFQALLLAASLPLCAPDCGAQAAAEVKDAGDKPTFNPSTATDAPPPLPNPYDKFLGLDQVLRQTPVNWQQVYNDIAIDVEIGKISDEIDVSLALGVKIADGVMAIKAKDAEALNDCSNQIEELAKKLGVAEGEMGRAEQVRADANRGEWLKVFMELGFLQTDIMNALRREGNEKRRPLIVVSGWMQGAYYTSSVIGKNYSSTTSNFLREPMLVKALQEEVDKLPAEVKSSDKVQKMLAALPQIYDIVNIPLDGSIPQDQVARLETLSREIVEAIVSN